MDELEDYGEEEEHLLRAKFADELPLKAAHLGFDMNELVHIDEAGKHLIESALDALHNSMLELVETDLRSDRARDLQVTARGAKLMIDCVLEALEHGRAAAFMIADNELEREEARNARREDP